MAQTYADYAITEAGFAFDLGAEKFFDIKCRSAGLNPAAVVIVATVRALKMHGGTSLSDLTTPDPRAVERGLDNLAAHLDAAAAFGKPTLVAINQRAEDTEAEMAAVRDFCRARSVACEAADIFAHGGAGGEALARAVVEAASVPPTPLRPLYELTDSYESKLDTIARRMYGADGVVISADAQAKLKRARRLGFDQLPICMAKTQDSLSDNPRLRGRPRGFQITIRDIELATGAGFLVALTGDIVRMPGLPQRPAAERIGVDAEGQIFGL